MINPSLENFEILLNNLNETKLKYDKEIYLVKHKINQEKFIKAIKENYLNEFTWTLFLNQNAIEGELTFFPKLEKLFNPQEDDSTQKFKYNGITIEYTEYEFNIHFKSFQDLITFTKENNLKINSKLLSNQKSNLETELNKINQKLNQLKELSNDNP